MYLFSLGRGRRGGGGKHTSNDNECVRSEACRGDVVGLAIQRSVALSLAIERWQSTGKMIEVDSGQKASSRKNKAKECVHAGR